MGKIQDLSKFTIKAGSRGRNIFIVQLWYIINSTFFAMSPQVMNLRRIFLLRIFGAKIGSGVIIRSSAIITYPWKLNIGNNSWIGEDVTLYNLDNIIIGSDVVISQKSYLCTGSHDYSDANFPQTTKPIIVKDQVWVAADVFIFCGVELGEGCIVGCRSSVYTNIPDRKICFGNPARVISDR